MRVAEIAFEELGIVDQLRDKLHSVVGSLKYLRVTPGSDLATWTWTIGETDVMYLRYPHLHSLTATYSRSR